MKYLKRYSNQAFSIWSAHILTSMLFWGCGQSSVEEESHGIDPNIDGRPNILWLVAEDLGYYIPPFGDSTIQTPNISRLAAEGVRYTNVY